MHNLKKYIPEEVLAEVIKVLDFGDTKHPGENWKKQSEALHLGHAMRHINYFLVDRIDTETQCSHLAHAVCRLLFAMGVKNEKNNT
jgi:hypothetical protein